MRITFSDITISWNIEAKAPLLFLDDTYSFTDWASRACESGMRTGEALEDVDAKKEFVDGLPYHYYNLVWSFWNIPCKQGRRSYNLEKIVL